MTSTKSKQITQLFIALILCPSGLGQNVTVAPTNTLPELSALEARISTAWRNGDHKSLETNSREALMKLIPKALDGAANIVEIVGYVTRSVPFLQVLSPIFSILSVVVDVINLTVFGTNSEFADLYNYLQNQFAVVSDRIKAVSHAIQDVLSFAKCSEAYKEVKSRQIQIDASYDRYLEMTQRGRNDSKAAQELFDAQQRQYPSNQILWEMRSLLLKKSLYTETIDHCVTGNITQYYKMMTELGETFMKAIFLDTAATTRASLSKSELDATRTKWKGHLDEVISLMMDAGNKLITVGWHSHYMNDVDKLMSSGSVNSISDLGDTIYSFLKKKYPYISSKILVVKNSETSISVVDALGAEVKSASKEKFLCYRGNRANGDTVIVICNNRVTYSTEQHIWIKTVLTIKIQQKLNGQTSSWSDLVKTGKIDYTASDGMPSVHSTGQFDEFGDLVITQNNCTGSAKIEQGGAVRKFEFRVIAKQIDLPASRVPWFEPILCRAAVLNPCGIAMTAIAASWLVVQRVHVFF